MGTAMRRDGQAGYTFVEMMVAIVIATIVGVGVYAIFNYQHRAAQTQRIANELQTGCRYAIDQVKHDLTLAGYRAWEPTRPIKLADPDAIAFEYWDERAGFEAPFAPEAPAPSGTGFSRHTLVSLRLEGGSLVRTVRRGHQGPTGQPSYYDPGTPDLSEAAVRADFAGISDPRHRQVLAANVDAFELRYFRQNNEPWDRAAASPPPFDQIRSVVVTLQCRADEANPAYRNVSLGAPSERFQTVRVQTEVRLRNVDIAANPRDATPPGDPKNLRVWDPGLCGRLEVGWDANREVDLAGYTLYYGLAPNSYSNRLRLARAPGAVGERVRQTLLGLQSSTACDTTPVTYYFRVEAFDRSGNPSTRSAEVSGNPSPSLAVESTGGSDTTINPGSPPAPPSFAAATPADNQVLLSWTAPPVDGVVGYRLYRGDSAAFVPSGRRVGDAGANILADETTLGAGVLSYLDGGLPGCVAVYYKLAAVTCDPCLPIPQTAFAATWASPTDVVKPSAPKLVARAGFKRVILSLENPVRATEPDFKETRVFFNPGVGSCTYPTIAADGTVGNGRLIPDAGGVFAGEGTQPTVNFDDADVASPAQPNLGVSSSYCFLAVAYDRCGNHSDASDLAMDVGQQCGDCMTKDDPPLPDPACYNAPPPPGQITTAGCFGSIALGWTHADPAGTLVRDFTGYRVYRCDNAAAAPCSQSSTLWQDPRWELLTGADPVWFSSFVDTPDKGLQEGHRYSYRILATDCYWEQHHGEPPSLWPDPANDPSDNAAEGSPPRPLTTGRLVHDPLLVLSGAAPSADWLQYLVSPQFRHHTVLLRVRNTADAALGLQQGTLAWENPEALLQRVALGDNASTLVTPDAWADLAPPLTQVSGGTLAFKTGVAIEPLDAAVPVHLTFARADGALSDAVNLRENQLQLALGYRNESTGDLSCAAQQNVRVPLGPYVSGTTQSKPQEGTVAAPVPGASGKNPLNIVLVPGAVPVDVFANVADSDLAGIREVRLYYFVDAAKTLAAAPAPAAGARYDADPAQDNLAPYARIGMVHVAGSQWRTPVGGGIPAASDANVWYFVVAADNNGNFDREPEPDAGAFQYYQQPYAVCDTVPAAPVLSFSESGSSVTLFWSAPTLNTDGSPLTDLTGYKLYRSATAGGTTVLAEPKVGGLLTYVDASPEVLTQTFTYAVTALDGCAQPGPNEGPASNTHTECLGSTGCGVQLIKNQGGKAYFQAGDSFDVELFTCDKSNGVSGETVFVQVCSGADTLVLPLAESGDTGLFRAAAGTVTTSTSEPVGDGDAALRVGADDTVRVHAWSATAPTGACGTLTGCSATLAVLSDACAGIAAPATPALTVAVAGAPGSCSGNDPTVNLSWTGTDPGPRLFYRVYRCSNGNNKADCLPVTDGTKILPLGAEPNLGQTTRTATDRPGLKANGSHIWYQVEAVSHNGCTNGALWKAALSAPAVDPCP